MGMQQYKNTYYSLLQSYTKNIEGSNMLNVAKRSRLMNCFDINCIQHCQIDN